MSQTDCSYSFIVFWGLLKSEKLLQANFIKVLEFHFLTDALSSSFKKISVAFVIHSSSSWIVESSWWSYSGGLSRNFFLIFLRLAIKDVFVVETDYFEEVIKFLSVFKAYSLSVG